MKTRRNRSGNRRTFWRSALGASGQSLAPRLRRLRFEPLEDRTLLSVFTVINTFDDGPGSLRQALIDSNADANDPTDTIAFSIPGAGPHTIRPTLALPTVTDPVVIDGTTQPGYAGTPIIEVDGSSAGHANGLTITADNTVVRGLVLNRFDGAGILLQGGSENRIQGNFIGTDVSGTVDFRNYDGVVIIGGQRNFIGTNGDGVADDAERNIISANASVGVYIGTYGTDNNVVAGNYIGTDVSGTLPLGNGFVGVLVGSGAQLNRIGTNGDGDGDDAEGNVISGSDFAGVGIYSGAIDNVVAGNFIGSDKTGNLRLGNGYGVFIYAAQWNRIGTNADGLADRAERNVISGNEYDGVMINSDADHNTVAGNLIGTDATGMLELGNMRSGVYIFGRCTGNVIGTDGDGESDVAERNVISGNRISGVYIYEGSENVVAGNYIGTDITGAHALGNYCMGVYLGAARANRVGTNGDGLADTAERNVIAGSVYAGVHFEYGAWENVVAGNYIGTDVSGSVALPNTNGVYIGMASTLNVIGTNGDGKGDAAEGNVISGNLHNGVMISAAYENVVAGNFIGTDPTGTVKLPNDWYGIHLDDARSNVVGTNGDGLSDSSEGNLISGNGVGVVITGAETTGNVVAGNYIGTDVTGTVALGNAVGGVIIAQGSNQIGGVAPLANTIAFNGGFGVEVVHVGSIGNSIRANAIHSNIGLGIDLGGYWTGADGVTPNDPLDADAGPNNLQNFPVLSLAEAGTSTHVAGTLNSTPNTTFTLDFYANTAPDPSGYGEGERWLGSITATTDGSGDAAFDVILTAASYAGEVITATATDPSGNTSEFSFAAEILMPAFASLSGTVFVDVNQNGLYEANEPGIDGVTVELLDESGDLVTTTTTGSGGFYLFEGLEPGTYQLHEIQPSGVSDGAEILGSLGGTIPANDTMQLTLARIDAADYIFAELGQDVTSGDTATIGFWQNKHGQDLIGQGGADLANWLTDHFDNVFGNTFADGDGDDGLEVAAFFKDQLFRQKSTKSAGPAKVDAQFMAVALASYFTSLNLAGNVAADFGFNVTDTGIGTKIVNVTDNGAAFDVADGIDLTIMQLLLATNGLTDNVGDGSLSGFAHIYDRNGDGAIDSAEAALRVMANDVYSAINEAGSI